MPSSHLILCRPLPLLPPIPPSIRVFSSESTLRMRWPKYWSFSFSISPSSEHPGLISVRMDWLDLLAVQGTLKSLLQHQSSKASILWCSAFFTVQLSHPYMTTGKTNALTRWANNKFINLFVLWIHEYLKNFIKLGNQNKKFMSIWIERSSIIKLSSCTPTLTSQPDYIMLYPCPWAPLSSPWSTCFSFKCVNRSVLSNSLRVHGL